MTETILANATLVLPGEVLHGQVRLAEGRIADIAGGRQVSTGALDCGGDLVLPGLVELHTDNLERHIEPRPRVGWPHLPAIIAHDAELASVGITTVFDALRVGSLVKSKTNSGEYARGMADEILSLRRSRALKISHLLHLRAEVCSDTLVEELAKFGPEDEVGIVSLMDHTPGQRQFRDMSKLKEYYTGKYGISEADWQDHVSSQLAIRDRLGALHEAVVVSEAGRLGAVLASHDDTTASQVATSAAQGVQFAEFPTTVEAAAACREAGIKVMMGAPNLVRGGSHSGNVAASALAEAGLLDILSSDYVPSSLLSGALLLADIWGDVARGIATVTSAPAAAAGLQDRGRLQVGARADVIRVARLGPAVAPRGVWVRGERVG
jgi:alpha-D-ribose 1-methylphosphonate 5-triphosphate diphosphatase